MKAERPGSGVLRWGLSLIVALGVILVMGVPGARATSPLEDVKGLITEVQTILQSQAQKSERLDLIEKLTAKHLDFQEMARRCLGSTWSTLNSAQKAEFVQLFSQLLQASYANHLEDFVKARVNYQGESCEAEHAEVRIVVIRPNDRIPVSFSLMQKPQGWMIYDLNIEGVSMVNNYCCQFQRAISAISYQGLVGRLKAHLKAESKG